MMPLVKEEDYSIFADTTKVRMECKKNGSFIVVHQDLFQSFLHFLRWEDKPESMHLDLQSKPYQKIQTSYVIGQFIEVKIISASSCFQGLVRLYGKSCDIFIKSAATLLPRLISMSSKKKKIVNDATTQTTDAVTTNSPSPVLVPASTPLKHGRCQTSSRGENVLRGELQPPPITISSGEISPLNVPSPCTSNGAGPSTILKPINGEPSARKRSRLSLFRKSAGHRNMDQPIPRLLNFSVDEEEDIPSKRIN